MRALGELVLHRPTSGAFVSYAREFYGEKWAYVSGWMYWLNWALTGIAELSAVGLYVQFWFPTVPTWQTVLIALAVVLSVNLVSAAAFGEFEFWAALLKVTTIMVFLCVGLVVVIGGFHIGSHRAGFQNLWNNPGGFWPSGGGYYWYGPILVMSGVVFAYAAIEMVAIAAGEMQDARREVPKAVNAVIFRIGVFYCGSILLLCSMLPTSQYVSGISPFVTVFGAMGLSWMDALIQGVLIIAAMSSLNSGLFSTGRVLRSLGMSREAPAFTTRMSPSGVPWGGIVLTSVVYVAGALLNAVDPAAFENTLEAAALGVLFTWGVIFACQLRLRQLTNLGVVPPSTFQMPGYPYTSIAGLVFLGFVVFGMAVSGWQSSPYFWHKTDFLVVAVGIPVIALLLTIGWVLAKPKIAACVDGRLKPMWSADGPTYPPAGHSAPPDVETAPVDPPPGPEGGSDAP
jgi:L-asparagine permease